MIISAIVLAEVAFWALLIAGLFARYILKLNRISIILLALTPIVDLALLLYTFIDMTRGESSNFTHGLSVFYIAFTIAFGPKVVRRLDGRFARFSNGEQRPSDPIPPYEKDDLKKHRNIWSDWIGALCAGGIAVILLVALIFAAGLENSFWLIYWIIVVVTTVALWWFIGPFRSNRKLASSSTNIGNTNTQS